MRISRIIIAGFICLFTNLAMASNAADSVSETKNVSVFTVLKIQGNFNVVLTQGRSCGIKVTAPDKDVMSAITIKQTANVLNVTMKDGIKEGATLYISVKDNMVQISATINGSMVSEGTINADAMALNIDGNTSVNMDLDIKTLMYNSSSNKDIVLKGKIKKCTLKDMGEGSVDASELKTDNMNIDDSSDGDLKVYAHPEMHVKLTGTGNFTYYGNPRTKTFKLEGGASEKQINEGK